MICKTEHDLITPAELQHLGTEDALRRRINYDTRTFVPGLINLMRFEFSPRTQNFEFSAYYRIGAEWLDPQQTTALVVTPKIPEIDFLEMFMTCLADARPEDDFSAIYDIDFDVRPIQAPALSAILSPLLVVQFLSVVERIAARSLRKGYVGCHENISKVKGRIDIIGNERHNILTGHRERVLCRFDEFSADTPENRYIKSALCIAGDMIAMMADHRAYPFLAAKWRSCLSAFASVADVRPTRLPAVKHNKLYRDYTEALRLASMLVRRRDLSVSSLSHAASRFVPVFRIDMALLFEHYTLALLRRRFGSRAILYQAKGYRCRFVPDFLLNTTGDTSSTGATPLKAILDAKYIPGYNKRLEVEPRYIRQLAGYARDKTLLRLLHIDTTNEDTVPILPCVILYPLPTRAVSSSPSSSSSLSFSYAPIPSDNTVKFFRCPVPVPLLPFPPR